MAGAAAAAALTLLCVADLPVHCLQHEIVGRWTFHIGASAPTPQHCAHHLPGRVMDVVTIGAAADDGNMAAAGALVGPIETLELVLESPDLASAVRPDGTTTEVGWWTMVYDQGFEVRLGGRSFFAFSSVLASKTTPAFESRCSTTAIGWYRDTNLDTDAWGCYYGVQKQQEQQEEEEEPQQEHPKPRGVGANHTRWLTAPSVRTASDARPDALKYAGLPGQWDWRDVDGINYVPPVRTQGPCGACYAIATVAMLESRLAIASGGRERPSLSVQHVLSCSAYSQGCLGGFPYLVGKYLTDVGVASEACYPSAGHSSDEGGGSAPPSCTEACAATSRTYRASDYRYVGGHYGGCSESQMMHEIHRHGPIVAGVQASPTLYTHVGGIFSSPQSPVVQQQQRWQRRPETERLPTPNREDDRAWNSRASTAPTSTTVEDAGGGVVASRKVETPGDGGVGGSTSNRSRDEQSFFEHTNHAVLLVGWGTDMDGRKYWLAQNTWGELWGEGGYFRVARGSDDSAIESMAVAIDVEGELPLPLQQRLTALEADDDVEPEAKAARWAEARRVAALGRSAHRRVRALTPEVLPPPPPPPRYQLLAEPRERGLFGLWAAPVDSSAHHSLLDSLAHWRYGGG
jgi:cathepsin C